MTDTWQDVPPARAPAGDGWEDVPAAPAPEPALGTQGIADRLSRGFAATNNPFAIYAGGKIKDIAADTATFFHEGVEQTVGAITGNGPSQLEDLRPEVEKQLISVGRTPEAAKAETEQLMRSWRRQERMGGAVMGPLTALTAPLLGAYRSLISRPLEEAGGPPKEVTETFGMVAGAMAGLPVMSREMARVSVTPDGKVTAQRVGDLPKGEDFRTAAELVTQDKPGADPVVTEQNLRTLWDERGIHPAEALNEAKGDAWLKHELTQPAPPEPEKIATAAIRVEGKTFTGVSHGDAIIAAEDTLGLKPDTLSLEHKIDSGFLTTTGRFVDRHEADRIARGSAADTGGLDSWDLPALHDQIGAERIPHPDRPLGEALRAADELRAANRSLPNEDRAVLGELISAVRSAAAKRQLSVEDGVVQQGDRFKKGPVPDQPPAADAIAEHAWVEADQDLARAQAALARIDEVKGRHPELAGQIDAAARAVEDTLAQRDQMRPKSLGAAATDPPLTPLTEQPPPPAGSLIASAQEGVRTLFDIGRDIQMKVAPMATGTRDAILTAKDFANTMRKNRWEWARIHDYLSKTFSPEQWKRMWDAADEESVMRQEVAAGPKGVPPVKPGFVRFFHGYDEPNRPTLGGGRWVTTDPEYAKNFRTAGTPKDVAYVDIPIGDPTEIAARAWDPVTDAGTNMVGRYNHIEVPERWAKQMKPFKAGAGAQMSPHMGLATLTTEERAIVDGLHARAENAWLRARDIGLVEGEGLPAYTPRMVINAAGAIAEQGSLPLNSIGTNLKASTARLMKRKYLTAEETEAAAKAKTGYAEALKLKNMDEINAAMEKVELVRDIRTLPLAIAQLEDAIAGRTLVNEIKKAGKAGGDEAVVEGAKPAGSDQKWFTIDHPALKTWRPKFQEIDGKVQVLKDKDGNTIFEQVPIYIRGDFEGPLRAVLDVKSGAAYQATMALKGKTMSMIMYSPAIHNLVEFGRAFPAMPTRIFKAYFDGNRAKNDVAIMTEAIDSGLVPIGKRFFNQDITAITEAPDLTPGRSWTAKVLAAVPGLFDEGAGTAVKRAVDKAGDFWHNTLLWDRIGDLQMGLYTNLRGDLIAKGVDQKTASITAAHWANRYAGALPQEAMSSAARKSANMLLFSRSFTMGNLGVMKDMVTGLPKDSLAMIERAGGFKEGSLSSASDIPQVGDFTRGMAMRKAMMVVALDIGLMYVGNSVLQSSLDVMLGDKTIDEEAHGYTRRFKETLNDVTMHPLQLLQPFSIAERLSSTGDNEPGRKDRIKFGYQGDGTGIYMRNPIGKIGEEFVGYMSPLEMFKKKEGTVFRPLLQIFNNDKGFGRVIYDKNAETPMDKLAAVWAMVEHFMKAQTPEGQINALSDLIKGEGDPKTSALQTAGPFVGVTFSKGAPGGPATGELYDFRQRHETAVNMALPDIRKQILRGDMGGAMQKMRELNIPPGLQRFYIRTTLDPSTRVGGRTLRDFYMGATPEQRDRLERARQ